MMPIPFRGGTVPSVGQYTKGLTIPYYQRHSKSPNDTGAAETLNSSLKHTFGDERYDDSFIQKAFGKRPEGDREGSPGVGQYTKSVAIPYYQRHMASKSNKTPSPSQFQRWDYIF